MLNVCQLATTATTMMADGLKAKGAQVSRLKSRRAALLDLVGKGLRVLCVCRSRAEICKRIVFIELDVLGCKLQLDVTCEELAKRCAAWQPLDLGVRRGYYQFYIDHVMQADGGADFDFLVGNSGAEVTRESH